VDIQAEVAAALGLRITLTCGSLNLTIEEGSNAVPGSVQDTHEILADCERAIGRWHDRRGGSMTQVALAPCAPFNVTKRLMTETASRAPRVMTVGCTLTLGRPVTKLPIAKKSSRADRSITLRRLAG